MSEGVKGVSPSKAAAPAGGQPTVRGPQNDTLPDAVPDSASVRRRPLSPQDLLAEMVRRAKEAETAARQATEAAAEAGKQIGEAVQAAQQDPQGTAEAVARGAGQAAEGAVKGAGQAADEASKRLQDLAKGIADGVEKATRPPAAQAAPESKPQGSQPVQPKESVGFFKGLWEGTKNFFSNPWEGIKSGASKLLNGLKGGLGKIWEGIKWLSDKTGLTTALKWAWPKVTAGFTWFQQNLRWLIFGIHYEPFKTRKVYDDPGDVNMPDFQEIQKAKKEIPERAAKEKEALAKLSPEQQKQYEALAKLTEKRPLSRWALQNMILDGRLPGDKPLRGDGDLLSQLARLETQELAKDVKREDLVSDLVAEIENPARINQQGKGTCVATTAQIILARKHPAEYARVIGDLAAPAGEAVLAGGGKLKRAEDWTDPSDGNRAVPTRLINPPLMDMGQLLPQPILDYSNKEDKSYLGPIPLAGGLMSGGSAKINSELEGRKYDSITFFHWNRDSQWNKVKQAIAEGRGPVPIGLQWEDLGGHEVQVDRVENGTVYYLNPWGQWESIDEAELKRYITSAEIPR